MTNSELEDDINRHLNSADFQDYTPNGLQVEGRRLVKKIICGVTACQRLLDQAVALNADAVIVHHGYFWKNESPTITGIQRQRLRTLLINDINLYSWHLPLDAHPQLGNNAQLALALDIQPCGELAPLVSWGELRTPCSGQHLAANITTALQRRPLHIGDDAPPLIRRVAWCTGAGQDFLDIAARAGMDAFITGEVAERSVHYAREARIHLFAAGHHATERGGIRALGAWLAAHYPLEVTFIDIDNPV